MGRAAGLAAKALRVSFFGSMLVSWSGPARAADVAGVDLVVTQGAGTEDCPTESAIAELLRPELQGEPATGEARPAHVIAALTRDGAGYTARVSVDGSGGTHGERILNAAGPTCGALAQALLVTLVLLWDVSPVPAPPTPEKPAAPPPPPPVPSESSHGGPAADAGASNDDLAASESTEPERPPRGPSAELWGAAGGAVTSGLPQSIGVALGGEFELRVARWSLGADLIWTPETALTYSPGQIVLQTWGGAARGCFALVAPSPDAPRAWLVRACAEAMLESLHGDGRNFDVVASHDVPWVLLGAGLDTEFPVAPGWAIGLYAAALVPTGQYTFYVTNGAAPYQTDAIVGWLDASLRLRIR